MQKQAATEREEIRTLSQKGLSPRRQSLCRREGPAAGGPEEAVPPILSTSLLKSQDVPVRDCCLCEGGGCILGNSGKFAFDPP